MAEIAALVARRGQFKGQLTRFSTFIKENEENVDQINQIVLRMEKAKEVWQDYEQVQSEIEEDRGVSEETEKYREDMEKLYYEAMVNCEKVLSKRTPMTNDTRDNEIMFSGTHKNNENMEATRQFTRRSDTSGSSSHSVPSIIKLAAIDIPKFSGIYSEWKSFFDIFTALVHNNDALNDVQKYFYLRSSLNGDAERVVQCFQITNDNYNLAWHSLIERYDNNKLLVQAHTKSLYELEPVRHESAYNLRKLYDSVSGHIKSLETLGQNPNGWGSLLLHLIASKMDYNTIRQWEIESSRSEVPSIKNLLDFLQNRFRMLEAIESSSSLRTNTESSRGYIKSSYGEKKGALKSTSLVTFEELKCYICKQGHTIYRCPSFAKLSVTERIKHISELKHCKNCLKSHLGEKCKSRRCSKCGRAHNVLLHLSQISKNDKTNEQVPLNPITKPTEQLASGELSIQFTTINAHTYKCTNDQVLLSTAIVYADNYLNKPVLCRVLLDSGSQNNFITEEMGQQLKREKIEYSVYGINHTNNSVSQRISTKIKSRVSNFEVNLNFLILSKLTSQIPLLPIKPSSIKIPAAITLADPSFNAPQKIDMLIGAEIFFELMCEGQFKPVPYGPIFKNTSLGWIVSGPISSGTDNKKNASLSSFSCDNEPFTSLEKRITKFWQLEEITCKTVYSKEEKLCRSYFDQNVKRNVDGRYVVSLPFSDVTKLGKSYDIALRRFFSLEKRIQSDPKLKTSYIKFMNEYLSLGHMELIPSNAAVPERYCYYIPHHAVHKENSLTTKLRVVFDASCKTDTGVSLNDVLLKDRVFKKNLYLL